MNVQCRHGIWGDRPCGECLQDTKYGESPLQVVAEALHELRMRMKEIEKRLGIAPLKDDDK